MTGRGQMPETAQDGLRALADWLDEADRLIDKLAAARMLPRPNSGDEVQQDMAPPGQRWCNAAGRCVKGYASSPSSPVPDEARRQARQIVANWRLHFDADQDEPLINMIDAALRRALDPQ